MGITAIGIMVAADATTVTAKCPLCEKEQVLPTDRTCYVCENPACDSEVFFRNWRKDL